MITTMCLTLSETNETTCLKPRYFIEVATAARETGEGQAINRRDRI